MAYHLLHDALCSGTSGVLPEGPGAQTIIWPEFALGYLKLDNGAVFIAATHLDPPEFKIRKVQDWSEYDVDASASFPLSALRRWSSRD